MTTTRSRTTPAKTAEHDSLKREIEQLREDLYEARYNILALLPDETRQLIKGYHQCHDYDELMMWQRGVIEQLIAVASSSPLPTPPGSGPRATCPLCHQGPQSFYETGFSLPVGLQRHMEGYGNVHKCVVMATVVKLAKERWRHPVLF